MNNIPIIVLTVVFILIATRQIGKVKLQIWQIMSGGAIAVLFTGGISLKNAFAAINFDVILFLFGMFVVGQALEESGYLSHLTYKFFKKAKNLDFLLLYIIFGMGFASAILMNDTLAIIGTPVVLNLAKNHKMAPKVLLLALAFSITIGSVMSPIGNPQNLLIALHSNMQNTFIDFLKHLFLPTLINLFILYILLKLFYHTHFHKEVLKHSQEPIKDKNLSILSKISLYLILILIFIKINLVFLKINIDFKLTYIALISALPVILFSPKRYSILKRIDWQTIIFLLQCSYLCRVYGIPVFFKSL